LYTEIFLADSDSSSSKVTSETDVAGCTGTISAQQMAFATNRISTAKEKLEDLYETILRRVRDNQVAVLRAAKEQANSIPIEKREFKGDNRYLILLMNENKDLRSLGQMVEKVGTSLIKDIQKEICLGEFGPRYLEKETTMYMSIAKLCTTITTSMKKHQARYGGIFSGGIRETANVICLI
jgi:hypothetical protein